jgi:WD40 repeat protein
VLTGRRNDPALRLWEVATGKELRQYRQPELARGSVGLIAAAFSPTGRVLACSRLDGTVELWETITGKTIAQFRGHKDSVRSLVFAADGRRVASASSDGTVLLWDVTAGPARECP